MRWLAFVLLAVSGLLVIGLRYLPPEWDPRTPLDLVAKPNALAGPKLGWMTSRPEACFAAFGLSSIPITRVPDRPSNAGCDIRNAVRLASSVPATPAQPIVTCPLAAAWILFERNTLQPAAQKHLQSEVVAVRHLGTYACRNVNHATAGRRSQHATANAIDIAGFVLRDGREVRLAQDWTGTDSEAAFLRAVRDGACRWFRGVLGPDYNTAHHDHFHFDMGPWRVCR
jgi:hypothetical protein